MYEIRTTPDWQARLGRVIAQEPLIETRPSLRALADAARHPAAPPRRRRPRAVFFGVGLCSPQQLGVALPVDVVGMLLPAERVRAAVGAESVIAVIADEHAIANGLDPLRVYRRAAAVEVTLARLRRALALPRLEIVRASRFHTTGRYRDILAEVTAAAPDGAHPYRRMQIADGAYLHRVRGGLLKVGWCVGPSPRLRARADEIAFDRCSRRWVDDPIDFVYCKPGRTLSDARPKAPPYVTLDPAARVCLTPDEDVARKLDRARRRAQRNTVRAYRNHLRALMYSVCRHVGPLSGPLEQRVQHLLAHVAAAPVPAPSPVLAADASVVPSPRGPEPPAYRTA